MQKKSTFRGFFFRPQRPHPDQSVKHHGIASIWFIKRKPKAWKDRGHLRSPDRAVSWFIRLWLKIMYWTLQRIKLDLPLERIQPIWSIWSFLFGTAISIFVVHKASLRPFAAIPALAFELSHMSGAPGGCRFCVSQEWGASKNVGFPLKMKHLVVGSHLLWEATYVTYITCPILVYEGPEV